MKYMILKNTDNWAKIMSPVLDAYNNNLHSATKIAPNKVNKDNEIQVLMNISKRAKKGTYPVLNIGDNVRFQFSINNTKDIKIVSVWKCTKKKTRIEGYILLMVHYIQGKFY